MGCYASPALFLHSTPGVAEMIKTHHIKPRNPLVAAARFRQAGVHRKSRKAQRRKANAEKTRLVQREVLN
jgi:hypothetical protein